MLWVCLGSTPSCLLVDGWMTVCRCLRTRKNRMSVNCANWPSSSTSASSFCWSGKCKKESGCNFGVWQGKYGSEQRPRRWRLGQMLAGRCFSAESVGNKVESVSLDLQVAIINIFRADQLYSSALFPLVPVFKYRNTNNAVIIIWNQVILSSRIELGFRSKWINYILEDGVLSWSPQDKFTS